MPIDGGIDGFGLVTTEFGSTLQQILDSDEIQPGDEPSYQLCKAIYIAHPLGAKMAESPIRLAQFKAREITVPDSPEDEVVRKFQETWDEIGGDRLILNVGTQSRVYGIASLSMIDGGEPGSPVDLKKLWKADLDFNVLDPLNTAGSLVTSQDPNSRLYQKWGDLWVQGTRYHRSRTITLMNEEPLYIAWTSSAFGFVGRSVYQRALYPLKSFLQTMRTDDMVTRKAGMLVARLEQPGSIVDRVMQSMFGVKRGLLKRGQTGNVLTIGTNELIEAVNLRNVNDSMNASRENIIKNTATAADMPAKMLTQEAYVQGFGEGTQDAYATAQYGDRVRLELRPVYRWMDTICMYRAWTPEFYETIKRRFGAEYGDVPYQEAFYRWRNSFRATWPDLIEEQPSEAVGIQEVKLKGMIALIQVLLPELDPDSKAMVFQWVCDQVNQHDDLFGGGQLELDFEALSDYLNDQAEPGNIQQQEQAEGAGKPPPPFSAHDSTRLRAVRSWLDSSPLGELGRRAGDSKVRLLAEARG